MKDKYYVIIAMILVIIVLSISVYSWEHQKKAYKRLNDGIKKLNTKAPDFASLDWYINNGVYDVWYNAKDSTLTTKSIFAMVSVDSSDCTLIMISPKRKEEK